jgi:hypothetical protein
MPCNFAQICQFQFKTTGNTAGVTGVDNSQGQRSRVQNIREHIHVQSASYTSIQVSVSAWIATQAKRKTSFITIQRPCVFNEIRCRKYFQTVVSVVTF